MFCSTSKYTIRPLSTQQKMGFSRTFLPEYPLILGVFLAFHATAPYRMKSHGCNSNERILNEK